MLPWLMVLQALVTLWLAVSCWRYARAAAADHASLWQAVAEQRMHHNALEAATQDTFADVGEALAAVLDESDDAGIVNVTPPPKCNCPNCRKRRQLEVN